MSVVVVATITPKPDQIDAVREALAVAEAKYTRALERLRHGEAGGALAPRPVASTAEVRRRLHSDEAFLEYLVDDTTSIVFVLRRMRS